MSPKILELKDKLRWNNLLIDWSLETPNETWEACEDKVQDLILTRFGIEGEVEVDRCHCVGKRQQEINRPSTIKCKITKFKDKQFILRNIKKLKDTGIFIYKSFSKETIELRKTLWEKF